jgi:hypothetical protein
MHLSEVRTSHTRDSSGLKSFLPSAVGLGSSVPWSGPLPLLPVGRIAIPREKYAKGAFRLPAGAKPRRRSIFAPVAWPDRLNIISHRSSTSNSSSRVLLHFCGIVNPWKPTSTGGMRGRDSPRKIRQIPRRRPCLPRSRLL